MRNSGSDLIRETKIYRVQYRNVEKSYYYHIILNLKNCPFGTWKRSDNFRTESSFEPKLDRIYWRKYFVILTNFEVKMNDDIIIKKISSFFQYFERTIDSKETNDASKKALNLSYYLDTGRTKAWQRFWILYRKGAPVSLAIETYT